MTFCQHIFGGDNTYDSYFQDQNNQLSQLTFHWEPL